MISKQRLLKPLFSTHMPHYPVVAVMKRLVIEVLVLAVFAFAALTGIAQAAPNFTEIPTIAARPTNANTVPPAAPTPIQPKPAQNAMAPQATKPMAQPCTKGSMPNPTPLSISTQQPGVTRVVTAPTHYTVHGTSINEVRQQIIKCSPVENGRYAAATTSTINWQITYSQVSPSANQCKLSNVAVGIHTSFIYPSWSIPTPRWNSFMHNLKIHEQGHADRDFATAQAIFTDLQTLPPTDCAHISANANAVANARVNALRHANATYDAETNHGTTQGAHL